MAITALLSVPVSSKVGKWARKVTTTYLEERNVSKSAAIFWGGCVQLGSMLAAGYAINLVIGDVPGAVATTGHATATTLHSTLFDAFLSARGG